ncbi:MAG: nucleoside recognition domain-containing protein [Candidatus Marinimicrobia bacterium]|nr:nucleoside recognition domain-containing protein [Candidatus Neomarinimicrobiota bacterium]MDD5582142.1 nucleoside recognition domain-containing protein [Candidatus Neomarinimicrobiota bacterium]
MINVIWLAMIIIGIVIASVDCLVDFVDGSILWNPTLEPLNVLTSGVFDSVKFAVTMAFGLIGIMTLWLGIMKIAEESGLIKIIARAVKPITIRLFPEVPPDHPAMGAIIMAIAASMLGLGNSATPLGLKAMRELQTLNKIKNTASNAMCMLMAISTSSVTIIPATIIGIRAAANSKNPAEIIAPVILATGISTTVAIIMTKILEKLPRYRYPESPEENDKREIDEKMDAKNSENDKEITHV